MIVADTSAWVNFLRKPASTTGREMDSLLAQNEIALTGIVLAEVLQGAKEESEYEKLRDLLDAVPFLEDSQETWAKVGHLAFGLRREGRPIPVTDAAVATVAIEHNCPILTLDEHFRRIPGLTLYKVKGS